MPVDRDWSEYPLGTKAYAVTGGHWIRVAEGWKWCNGATFPTPGGDACGNCVQLPHPVALAIMQNQWLHNAASHQRRQDAMRLEDEARWWAIRERAVPFALFRGCKSGQVLKRHLGDVTEEIVWEEASTRIGATASSCPPADPAHIRAILDRYVPPTVITFGKIASDAVNAVLDPGITSRRTYKDHALTFIQAPHPAARTPALQESVREACAALLNRVGR